MLIIPKNIEEIKDSVFIYTLSEGGIVRYVGKVNNLKCYKHRYWCHINPNEKIEQKTYKKKWINKVIQGGGEITMEIIDVCSLSNWRWHEDYWIHQLRAWGFNLTNTAEGGLGAAVRFHTNETKALISAIQSTGERKEISRRRVVGKTKTTYEQREQIIKICKEGKYSLSEIGDMYGIKAPSVHSLLKRRGIKLDKRTSLSSKEKQRAIDVSKKLKGRKFSKEWCDKKYTNYKNLIKLKAA